MDFSSQLANLQKTAASADRRDGDGHSSQQGRAKRPRHRRHYFNETAMKKALATLPHYRPRKQSPNATHRHIALLFITIDDLPYEHIWKEWMSSQDDDDIHVSVVCHAKFPERVKSEWLQQRLLVQPPKLGRGNEYEPLKYHSRRPEWGSIEITQAMLDLLHEGLAIGHKLDPRFPAERYGHYEPVDKFIFVSETCLPVSTLKEVKTTLLGSSSSSQYDYCSWVNARNTPNNGYSRQQQFEKVDPVIDPKYIYKADQWIVLARDHATAVMELDDRHHLLPRGAFLWQCFVDTNASDELYFPTALALLRILPSAHVMQRRVTFCDWSVGARNPASFTKGVEDLKRVAAIARKEGCLFARKFSPFEVLPDDDPPKEEEPTGQITVEEWKECIHALAEQSVEQVAEQSTEKSQTDT